MKLIYSLWNKLKGLNNDSPAYSQWMQLMNIKIINLECVNLFNQYFIASWSISIYPYEYTVNLKVLYFDFRLQHYDKTRNSLNSHRITVNILDEWIFSIHWWPRNCVFGNINESWAREKFWECPHSYIQ